MKKKALSIICAGTILFSMPTFANTDINTEDSLAKNINIENTALDEVENIDKAALEYLIENLKSEDYKTTISEIYDEISEITKNAEKLYDSIEVTQKEIDAFVKNASEILGEFSYIGKRKIISNNNSKIENYYPDVEKDKNSASYSYGASSPESITSTDSENIALSDGITDTYIKTGTTDTGSTEIIYDLGQNYYVTDVELFSGFYYNSSNPTSRNIRNIDGFSVLVSDDGINYTKTSKIKAKSVPDETDPGGLINTTIKTEAHFLCKEARYVKIIVDKYENSAFYQLGEVVIKGFEMPDLKIELYNLLTAYKNVKSSAYISGYSEFKKAYDKAEQTYFSGNNDEIWERISELREAYGKLVKKSDVYILSGNVNSDQDKALYDGIESISGMEVSYSYDENDSARFIDNDIDRIKLLAGSLNNSSGQTVVYGKWAKNTSGSIYFDMGTTVYLSQLDIWAWHRSNAHIKKAVVSVGSGGGIYTEVANVDFEIPVNEAFEMGKLEIPVTKDPIPGRYIKVDLVSDDNQMNISEIVIMGFLGENEGMDIPVRLTDVQYKDISDNGLSSLAGETEAVVSGVIRNQTKEEKDVSLVNVVYDKGGKTVNMKLSQMKLPANSSKEFKCQLNVEGGNTIETFVINDVKNGISLSQKFEFGKVRDTDIIKVQNGSENSLDAVEYDYKTNILKISGRVLRNKNNYREISMRLVAPGKNIDDTNLITDFNPQIMPHIAHISPGADGNFDYSFKFDGVTYGNHLLYITFADGTTKISPVFITNSEENKKLTDAANSANTNEKVEALFTDFEYITEGQNCMEELLKEMQKEEMISEIAGMIAGMKFEDSNDVFEQIARAAVVIGAENQNNADDFKKWLEDWKEEIKFEGYGIYETLYKMTSRSVTEKLLKADYKSADQFKKEFSDSVILDILNNIENYTEISVLLDAAREYLDDVDFDEYDTLTKTEKINVNKQVVKGYTSVEDFVADLNKAIDNKGKSPSGNSTGGSSGGSSGGTSGGSSYGGSGFVAQKPENVAQDVEKNVEKDVAKEDFYTDLDSALWAKESIEKLTELGIVSGKGNKIFAPTDKVTREEFVKMIVCAYNLPLSDTKSEFTDVDEDSWYAKYVISAYNSGIVFGVTEVEFGVGKNITREEMATIAMRAAGFDKTEADELFADDYEIADYAKNAIYSMKAKGIMSGKGDNLFAPKDYATRAEAARMIYMILQA